MHNLLKIVLLPFAFVFFIASIVLSYFGPVGKSTENIIFIVPQDKSSFNLTNTLYDNGLIKNKSGFDFLFNNLSNNIEIKEGGYYLSQSLNAWQVIKRINGKQDLMWVNIFFCPRKEQVGEKLANILGWDEQKIKSWNNLFIGTEYFEGVYYPDTYLIPVNESVEEVAKRFLTRFNEKLSQINEEFTSKNIKWTTGLKIASLIAREAAGREDANLISGIIWNRLNSDMRLQIDATMQYTLGKNKNGNWWGSINLDEKRKDSPYNSYLYKGLPPTPICSPNIDFLKAVLDPEKTECIFYLHDQNRQIHCAKTYDEHLKNIDKYLN